MIYIKKISKSNNSKKNKLLKVIILSTLLSYNSIFSNICRASSNESEDIFSILKAEYISMFEKKFLFKEKQIEETEDKNSIALKPYDVIAKSGI